MTAQSTYMNRKNSELCKKKFADYLASKWSNDDFSISMMGFSGHPLDRCCGAYFFSSLDSPSSVLYEILCKKGEEIVYRNLSPTYHRKVNEYCLKLAIKYMCKFSFHNMSRPFLSCITASYQEDVIKVLDKLGFSQSPPVTGNGSSDLIMWTVDARNWKQMEV